MVINRDSYLNKLIAKKENGLIKVITGVRRCGKSFLLFELYHEYLNSIGVSNDNIIELALDEAMNAKYRNPLELDQHIRERLLIKSRNFMFLLMKFKKYLKYKILMLMMQRPK